MKEACVPVVLYVYRGACGSEGLRFETLPSHFSLRFFVKPSLFFYLNFKPHILISPLTTEHNPYPANIFPPKAMKGKSQFFNFKYEFYFFRF